MSTSTPSSSRFTRRSSHSDSPSSIPLHSRPFSPSPPRETWHTASRPPSLLLGAPLVGTVAVSSALNIAGLPGTPEPYISQHEGIGQDVKEHGCFGYKERSDKDIKDPERASLKSHGAFESLRSAQSHEYDHALHMKGEGYAAGEFTRGSAIDLTPGRRRSDSQSTTSSASPPLGATSLLAALNGSAPSPSADRREGGAGSPAPSSPAYSALGPELFARPARVDDNREIHVQSTPSPTSPYRSNPGSSPYGSLALVGSRSLPRIHQPTVVRRPSGKGLSFLPPPAQLSPSGLAMPPRSRASLSHIHSPSTASFDGSVEDDSPGRIRQRDLGRSPSPTFSSFGEGGYRDRRSGTAWNGRYSVSTSSLLGQETERVRSSYPSWITHQTTNSAARPEEPPTTQSELDAAVHRGVIGVSSSEPGTVSGQDVQYGGGPITTTDTLAPEGSVHPSEDGDLKNLAARLDESVDTGLGEGTPQNATIGGEYDRELDAVEGAPGRSAGAKGPMLQHEVGGKYRTSDNSKIVAGSKGDGVEESGMAEKASEEITGAFESETSHGEKAGSTAIPDIDRNMEDLPVEQLASDAPELDRTPPVTRVDQFATDVATEKPDDKKQADVEGGGAPPSNIGESESAGFLAKDAEDIRQYGEVQAHSPGLSGPLGSVGGTRYEVNPTKQDELFQSRTPEAVPQSIANTDMSKLGAVYEEVVDPRSAGGATTSDIGASVNSIPQYTTETQAPVEDSAVELKDLRAKDEEAAQPDNIQSSQGGSRLPDLATALAPTSSVVPSVKGDEGGLQQITDVGSDDGQELHEVLSPSVPNAELIPDPRVRETREVLNFDMGEKVKDAGEYQTFAESEEGQSAMTSNYVPPYKPRASAKTFPPPSSVEPTPTEKLSLTLQASLTRPHSTPFESTRRVELHVAWVEPKTWAWVPGRRYIPDWNVRLVTKPKVGAHVQQQKGLVKSVLGSLPGVGAIANWIL